MAYFGFLQSAIDNIVLCAFGNLYQRILELLILATWNQFSSWATKASDNRSSSWHLLPQKL